MWPNYNSLSKEDSGVCLTSGQPQTRYKRLQLYYMIEGLLTVTTH